MHGTFRFFFEERMEPFFVAKALLNNASMMTACRDIPQIRSGTGRAQEEPKFGNPKSRALPISTGSEKRGVAWELGSTVRALPAPVRTVCLL